MREAIENARMRSAWDRGVQAYALELLDNYDEYVRYAANDGEAVPELSESTLLNGASEWSQYSWGGCSLIYTQEHTEDLPYDSRPSKETEERKQRGKTEAKRQPKGNRHRKAATGEEEGGGKGD